MTEAALPNGGRMSLGVEREGEERISDFYDRTV
jgi:hypothetical protein